MLHEALRRGHGVTAIARNPGSLARAGSRVVTADILDASAATPALRGQDCAIVSLRYSGLDFERLLKVLKESGVPRVVFVGGAASLVPMTLGLDAMRQLLLPGTPVFLPAGTEALLVAIQIPVFAVLAGMSLRFMEKRARRDGKLVTRWE